MRVRKVLHILVGALGLWLGLTQPASALIVTSTLGGDFSGPTDATGFPTITFDDNGGTGSVHVTLDNTNLAPAGTAFTSEWWFNFSGDATQLNIANFTTSGGDGVSPLPPTIDTCNNCSDAIFRPDGDGFFDIHLGFATGGDPRFEAGEKVEFDITLAGITAANFYLQSISGPGDTSNDHWCAATHAQGLGVTGGNSDFLGGQCSDPSELPEPGTLLLLGAGLTGVGFGRRRRARLV